MTELCPVCGQTLNAENLLEHAAEADAIARAKATATYGPPESRLGWRSRRPR